MAKDAKGHGSDAHQSGVEQIGKPQSGYYWHSSFSGAIPVKVHGVGEPNEYGRREAHVQVTARSNPHWPRGMHTTVPAHEVFQKGSLRRPSMMKMVSHGPTAARLGTFGKMQ